MSAVVIDTDVVSFRFKKDARARVYQPHLVGRGWVLSFMTLAELQQWSVVRHWGATRRAKLDRFLAAYSVCHSDPQLCRLWAEVSADVTRKGRPIETADAWIAATALALDVPLVTHNPGDYSAVSGLTVVSESGN